MEEYLTSHADFGLINCADNLNASVRDVLAEWERLGLEKQATGKVNAPMRVYVASPFSADTEEEVQANLEFNSDMAYKVFKEKGHIPFAASMSPVTQNAPDEGWEPSDANYQRYVVGHDFKWLDVCDALLLCGPWPKSKGCRMEYNHARNRGLWIYFDLYELPEIDHARDIQSVEDRISRELIQSRHKNLSQ